MNTLPLAASVTLLFVLAADGARGQAAAPLETIRNFQTIDARLTTAGQIGYEQVPLLAEQGFEVVVNLAIADEERNGREGFLVAEEGLAYVHIPVDWSEPTLRDLELFFDVMEANQDRKVFVHCFANMRVSAFLYLYRSLVKGVPEAEARATLNEIWDPNELEQWRTLIEQAQAAYGRG